MREAMRDTLELPGLQVEVVRKAVRLVHLSVLPPAGHVRVAAPERVPLEAIRLFVIDKLGWIRSRQGQLRAQLRDTPHSYATKESHWVWGRRRLLVRHAGADTARVELTPRRLHVHLREGAPTAQAEALLQTWHRQQVQAATARLLAHWQPRLGVCVQRVYVQRMKTRWGSCNPQAHSIRLNSELARKPPECLEYIVVHELLHLLEPTHNARFRALLDRYLPGWEQLRQRLNSTPLRHEDWLY
jgi:predicted metal-dependent hydrolase